MKAETKVGLMFLITLVMVVLFAYILGAIDPFSDARELNIAYNFAGGIEVGSPVRVMGIKVGKVKEIEFKPNQKINGEEVKLRVKITVSRDAWDSIRENSKYFINLAGVIGEKFLEITPGSSNSPMVKPEALIRGEDPPRIDQLISQSYGLAGKIMDVIEKNEGQIDETIQTMNSLVVNLNALLSQMESSSGRKNVKSLFANTAKVMDDVAYFTEKLRSKEGQATLTLINELIQRLEGLDKKALSKFYKNRALKLNYFNRGRISVALSCVNFNFYNINIVICCENKIQFRI